MDERLEKELKEILDEAEVNILAQHAKLDADALLTSYLTDAKAVQAMLLEAISQQGVEYMATVVATLVLKARALARVAFQSDSFPFQDYLHKHDDCEQEGHVLADAYARRLLSTDDHDEIQAIVADIQRTLSEVDDLKIYGYMVIQILSLSGQLIDITYELKDKHLLGTLTQELFQGGSEDEGDSRS